MNRNIWLAVIPVVVIAVGVSGNMDEKDASPLQPSVTYGKIAPVSGHLDNYVLVQLHEPFSMESLPREKEHDIPGRIKDGMLDMSVSEIDQSSLNMMKDAGQEEVYEQEKNNRKTRTQGFLGQQDEAISRENTKRDKYADRFAEDVNEGLGGGWLNDAIFSEEKRMQKEISAQMLEIESEPEGRRASSFTTTSGGFDKDSDKFVPAGGAQNDRIAPSKPSFRIESWKPKSK